jgi:hypothetical protein
MIVGFILEPCIAGGVGAGADAPARSNGHSA